jgi:hypothetical protein
MIATRIHPINERAAEASMWTLGLQNAQGAFAPTIENGRLPSRRIAPNGPEVFLPLLDAHTCYLIIVEGVFEYWGLWSWRMADAEYARDLRGCFTRPYQFKDGGTGVRLDREREPFTARDEDRELHRYTYVLFVGEKPLKTSVSLVSPRGAWCETRGWLTVSTRRATDQEISLYAPKPKEPPRSPVVRTAVRAVAPSRSAAGIARDIRSDTHRRQWVEEQIRHYEHSTSYTEETFLRDLAAKNPSELIARREEFHKEWELFHKDPKAIMLLKEKSPVTYERARFQLRALAFAEELIVKPTPLKKPAALAAPKPKETHAQWLERQLRHRRTKATDALARAEEKLTVIEKLVALNLDPDEHDRYLTAIHEAFAEPDANEEAYNAAKI